MLTYQCQLYMSGNSQILLHLDEKHEDTADFLQNKFSINQQSKITVCQVHIKALTKVNLSQLRYDWS